MVIFFFTVKRGLTAKLFHLLEYLARERSIDTPQDLWNSMLLTYLHWNHSCENAQNRSYHPSLAGVSQWWAWSVYMRVCSPWCWKQGHGRCSWFIFDFIATCSAILFAWASESRQSTDFDWKLCHESRSEPVRAGSGPQVVLNQTLACDLIEKQYDL